MKEMTSAQPSADDGSNRGKVRFKSPADMRAARARPSLLRRQIRSMPTVPVGEFEVQPLSEQWRLALPGLPFALNWSRPYQVRVRRGDGSIVSLRVQDPTLRALLGIAGLTLFGIMALRRARRR